MKRSTSESCALYSDAPLTLQLGLCLIVGMGCAAAAPGVERDFDFDRDIFAYTNNNYWVYDLDSDPRRPVTKKWLGEVDHGQRCTIMSRAARQFFYAARFEPSRPKLAASEYRSLVRKVLSTSPRREAALPAPIEFPGYRDLRSFSIEHEEILKETLGGRWVGYFQRGNWRMVFPFSPSQNRKTAEELLRDIADGHLPLVHVVNYPQIDINHTVLLFASHQTPVEITFDLYDPNNAEDMGSLVFDRAAAIFSYNRTDYFAGGRTQIYEIYDGPLF